MGLWIEQAPSFAVWLAMKGVFLVHAYWIGFGFVSFFTTHYYYPMLLTIEYFTEPVVWHCVRAFLVQRDVFAPPAIITVISPDMSLEVELAGAFLGFFVFHYWYNRAGSNLLGMLSFVVMLGFVVPLILTTVGAIYSGTHITHFLVFWIVGVLSGLGRAAAIASMFAERIETWKFLMRTAPANTTRWRPAMARMIAYLDTKAFAPLLRPDQSEYSDSDV